MASSLYSFQPAPSIVCSSAGRKPEPNRRNPNWWTPLFGWSADPDYINNVGVKTDPNPEGENGSGRVRPEKNVSVFRGCFTEEKAKELRRKTIETSTFHDIMYHSAIASRLASDVSGRAV